MTSPLWGKYCDGGHYCSAPKECCTLGCCYHALPADGVLGLWFLGHWYFWALVTAALVGALCACSLWRRCYHALRLRSSSTRDERASEPDSTGSCYAPPHYSRCNSFHHAPPPPYAEVTSKPDLYPLVISYNGDTGMKRGGSASYLMVQYFRNYILRPSGSISATSTIDSLSSSFICNAANEANTVIPPPYSCTGSLEGFTFTANSTSISDSQTLQHSASSLTCNDYQQQSTNLHAQHNGAIVPTQSESPSQQHFSHHNSPKYSSSRSTPNGQNSTSSVNSGTSIANKPRGASNYSPVYVHNKTTSFINNMPNTRFDFNETSFAKVDRSSEIEIRNSKTIDSGKRQLSQKPKKNVISTENSIDSETSQGDEHNFSELLNLSVCVPSSIINCDISSLTGTGEFGTSQNLSELQQSYSIANSVTVSDISSLANLGTPDSPPRATSPTVEIRELLDKIQQLPQQKSPAPEVSAASETSQQSKNNRFFAKSKSKTLYMPLNTSTNKQTSTKLSPSSTKHSGSIFAGSSGIFSYAGKTTKGWLSRSAPTTPCGNFVPLFPSQRKSGGSKMPKSHMGSKSKMDDASALLTEYEGSDDEQHNNTNDERL